MTTDQTCDVLKPTIADKIRSLPPRYPHVGHQYICGYNDAKYEAADIIEKYNRIYHPGWRDIASAPGGMALRRYDDGTILVSSHNREIFKTSGYDTRKPTHWMPLPQPPQEGSHE